MDTYWGLPRKTLPKPPLFVPSAINQGAVSGILESRCYQRCPVYTHTTASLISTEITDPPSNSVRPEPGTLAFCISISLPRSSVSAAAIGHFISDRGPQKKKKKQSICSGSCLKFNKCVSYVATMWCERRLQSARATPDSNLWCYQPLEETWYMSQLTNLNGHEIKQKSEAWNINSFLKLPFFITL